MAKRDVEPEPMDEEPLDLELPPVGERLRAAREARGLSLEDVAAQTRIPQRHLASIETGDWNSLPAPTYTIGFAKSYASAVGLDRAEIGNQLREEMGGQRFSAASSDVFEPADPARTMPKSLVIGAILAVIVLIALMSWLSNRSLEPAAPPQTATSAPAPVTARPSVPPPVPQPPAQEPVVLTATAPVWLQVSDKGGGTLFSGTLQPGQTYAVPATATAPVLKTGKPEGLRVTVGNAVAPPIGPPATTVHVSLLATDLMKAPAAPPPPRGAAPATRARAPSAAPAASAPQPTGATAETQSTGNAE